MIRFLFIVAGENRAGGHDLFYSIGYYLEFPYCSFGDAVKQINTTIFFRYSKEAESDYANKHSNDWLLQHRFTPIKFSRSKSELDLKYVSEVSTAEIELFAESKDASMFSKFCAEFIDKLSQLRTRIKETDDFKLDEFLQFLNKKKSQLPLSETALEALRQQEASFVWPAHNIETKGAKPRSKQIPKRIPIALQEPMDLIGTYVDGQFWGHVVDEEKPCTSKDFEDNIYSMVHLFDKNGKFIQTKFEKTPKSSENAFEIACNTLDQMLSQLPKAKFQKIAIDLFEDEVDGMQIGLLDDSDDEDEEVKAVLIPEGLVFFPPWDGNFDT
jgi:hypothetical protein